MDPMTSTLTISLHDGVAGGSRAMQGFSTQAWGVVAKNIVFGTITAMRCKTSDLQQLSSVHAMVNSALGTRVYIASLLALRGQRSNQGMSCVMVLSFC